jgi:hypothetical protein
MFVLSNALDETIDPSESLASVKWLSNAYRSPLTSVAEAMSGFGPSLTQAPETHLAGKATSVHGVLSALNGVEQTPAPEQVPASMHSVAGQVTPVHRSTQVPAPSHCPSPGVAIVQPAPAVVNGVEQTPAPEQVPASMHSVAGQVTPMQDAGEGLGEGKGLGEGEGLGEGAELGEGAGNPSAQHAAHPAVAQPSVHSSAQEPPPQQSRGAGDARAGAPRARSPPWCLVLEHFKVWRSRRPPSGAPHGLDSLKESAAISIGANAVNGERSR